MFIHIRDLTRKNAKLTLTTEKLKASKDRNKKQEERVTPINHS